VARPQDTITAFLCDDGALYGIQHGQLSLKSLEPGRLEIKAPPYGFILATGPAARDLALALCSNRATMIRRDGADLTSVTFLSKAQAAADAAQLDPALVRDPDLGPEDAEAEEEQDGAEMD
jgi:hypothetical protein